MGKRYTDESGSDSIWGMSSEPMLRSGTALILRSFVDEMIA